MESSSRQKARLLYNHLYGMNWNESKQNATKTKYDREVSFK